MDLVKAVHRWCDAQEDTPLRMDTLCLELAVPIWQLERAFNQTYGMPPQRLLALHRLAKARRELLGDARTVSDVAMANGFWHLGRFAVLYKDYFGESPSDTVRMYKAAGKQLANS